ncbi:MAG: hypothetical protein EOP56_06270 [Sphingobacteriales bacterium]|nr:MAG: hypothetical protein EOP56_06270 [Sphingobacteriales bacterium]
MLFYYLSLRLKQFLRFYRFSDIHPLIGIPVTLILFAFGSALLFEKVPMPEWLYLIATLGAVMELQGEKTNAYLRQMLSQVNFFKAKLGENLLILLPFIGIMVWKHAWIQIALTIALVVPYSWFSVKMPKPKLKAMRTPFAPYAFEHNMVFRSVSMMYVGYVLLLITGVVVQNFYVFLAPFFLLLFFTIVTYGLPEEPYYIWVYRTGANKFLLRKLKTLVINYLITFSLFALLGAVFYTSQLPMIALSFAVGLLCMIGCLFIKYHFYPSAIVIQISQMLFFALTVSCLASPLMLPAVVLFLIFSYFRARRNLKYILKC